MTQTSPFLFATEFSADGEVMSGPDPKYFSRDEAYQLAAKARAEGEARAKQATEAKAFASVDRIVVTLAPVAAQLSASLALVAISSEDAPDLLAAAPVSASDQRRRKLEAVATPLALVPSGLPWPRRL